jgi:hypothetical protein
MNSKTITCPKCGEEFELTEALYKDVEASIKKHFDSELKKAQKESQAAVERREAELKEVYEKRIQKITEAATKKASESHEVEIADLKAQLKENAERLNQAQQMELQLRKAKRELEDSKKAFELEMERKIDLERSTLRDKITSEIEEQHKLKDADKDKQLADMKEKIKELQAKSEQASQKMKGEVLEIEFEKLLKDEFRFDEIVAVSSGIRGADVVQIVKTQSGQVCGKILWETKRTKAWSDTSGSRTYLLPSVWPWPSGWPSSAALTNAKCNPGKKKRWRSSTNILPVPSLKTVSKLSWNHFLP